MINQIMILSLTKQSGTVSSVSHETREKINMLDITLSFGGIWCNVFVIEQCNNKI